MAKQEDRRNEVNEEMTKFEKTIEELHLLKKVSKDLKNYRKMIRIKKYD